MQLSYLISKGRNPRSDVSRNEKPPTTDDGVGWLGVIVGLEIGVIKLGRHTNFNPITTEAPPYLAIDYPLVM